MLTSLPRSVFTTSIPAANNPPPVRSPFAVRDRLFCFVLAQTYPG